MTDFSDPVWMSGAQFERFLGFMRRLYPNGIRVDEVREESRPPPGGGHPRRWTVDEYLDLLSGRNNDQVGEKLARSEMSVTMMRGQFVPEFFAWARKKRYSFPHTKKQIKEFMEDRGP